MATLGAIGSPAIEHDHGHLRHRPGQERRHEHDHERGADRLQAAVEAAPCDDAAPARMPPIRLPPENAASAIPPSERPPWASANAGIDTSAAPNATP